MREGFLEVVFDTRFRACVGALFCEALRVLRPCVLRAWELRERVVDEAVRERVVDEALRERVVDEADLVDERPTDALRDDERC